MKSAWILGLLATLACSTPAPAPTPAPPATAAPQAEGAKVVVIGDSLAAGLGLPADQAWPAVLERSLLGAGISVRVTNAGVSGDTTAGGLSRLEWQLRQKPDVVVIELGGNDMLRGQSPEGIQNNLEQICQAALNAGSKVVLVGMTAPETQGPEAKSAFDAIYPAIASKLGVTLVPGFLDPVLQHPELLQSDGLHPTAQGHERLAAVVHPVLARVLAEQAGQTATP